MKKILNSIIAAAVLLTVGCGTLAPDGVYKSQKVLYTADQTFETTHDIIDAFLKWEFENGDALYQLSPRIKAGADAIRKDAPEWINKYNDARKAYLLAPVKDNSTALEEALDQLERLAAAGQQIATQFN